MVSRIASAEVEDLTSGTELVDATALACRLDNPDSATREHTGRPYEWKSMKQGKGLPLDSLARTSSVADVQCFGALRAYADAPLRFDRACDIQGCVGRPLRVKPLLLCRREISVGSRAR